MVRRFTDVLHYRGVGIASALQAAGSVGVLLVVRDSGLRRNDGCGWKG